SFAGIVNKPDDKVQDVVREAAPKDIFSEISSIGLNDATQTFKAVEPQPVETMATPTYEMQEPQVPQTPIPQEPTTYEENAPENPDDIISQILNDNNRN
ncbi:MAG: hypothetical protein KAQ68_04440, partial [Clostridiales bacterium]|nr:hypothetical protein [Clostridiales bacterium]